MRSEKQSLQLTPPLGGLGPILKSLRNKRNKTTAHLDRRAVVDPDGYVRQGHVSYRQIEGLFEQTGLILNSLFQLYRGTTVPLDLIDASDYEQALDLIADVKCDQAWR